MSTWSARRLRYFRNTSILSENKNHRLKNRGCFRAIETETSMAIVTLDTRGELLSRTLELHDSDGAFVCSWHEESQGSDASTIRYFIYAKDDGVIVTINDYDGFQELPLMPVDATRYGEPREYLLDQYVGLGEMQWSYFDIETNRLEISKWVDRHRSQFG